MTDTPTEPGWYWYRQLTAINGNKFPRIVEIYQVQQTLYIAGIGPNKFLLENVSGEFQGHLTPREDGRTG